LSATTYTDVDKHMHTHTCQPFEFGVEESELHKLVPKIQLPEILLIMSKVRPVAFEGHHMRDTI